MMGWCGQVPPGEPWGCPILSLQLSAVALKWPSHTPVAHPPRVGSPLFPCGCNKIMMAAQDENKQESGFPWQPLLSEGLGMTPHRGSQRLRAACGPWGSSLHHSPLTSSVCAGLCEMSSWAGPRMGKKGSPEGEELIQRQPQKGHLKYSGKEAAHDTWKQTTINRGMVKVHIYNGILLSHERNKIVSLAETWMDQETVTEWSQKEKNKYGISMPIYGI